MENPLKKARNFINAAALSGAMISGSESIAQTNGDWTVVSPEEITRRHISESDIQTIDLKKNEQYEIDDSKLAIRFIDKGGRQEHYWINNNPKNNEVVIQAPNSSGEIVTNDTPRWDNQTENEIHKESDSSSEEFISEEEKLRVNKVKEEVSKIVEDPEIVEAFEKFKTEFFLEEPYAIDPRYPDKIFSIKHHSLYKNHLLLYHLVKSNYLCHEN